MADYLKKEDGDYLLLESSITASDVVTTGPYSSASGNLYKATFTAATTDIITAIAHGLLTDDRIWVSSSGTLPAGLSSSVLYFVKQIDANTFTVALTSGGSDVDITDTGSGTHTFAKGFGVNQTVAASNNRLLVVIVGYTDDSGLAVSSIAFGGASLTFASRVVQDVLDPLAGSYGTAIEYWYLIAPTVQTAEVAVKMNTFLPTNPTYAPGFVSCLAAKNVHQSTPFGSFFQNESAGANSFSVDVTGTSSRGMVIDAICYNATAIPTASVGAGQTVRGGPLPAGSNPKAIYGYQSEEVGNGGTVTMSWTMDGGIAMNGQQLAVEIKPVDTATHKILLDGVAAAAAKLLALLGVG